MCLLFELPANSCASTLPELDSSSHWGAFLNLCVLIGHCITVQIKYNLLISLEWRNLVEALHRWTNLKRPLGGAVSPGPNLPDSNSTTTTLHNALPWHGPPFRGLMHPSIAWSWPEVSVTAFYGTCMHAFCLCVIYRSHPCMWTFCSVSHAVNRLCWSIWIGRFVVSLQMII